MLDRRELFRRYQRSRQGAYFERLHRLREVAELIRPGSLVLDVGCHDTLLRSFLDGSCSYVGVGISLEALKEGRGDRALAAAENLPFRDYTFDQAALIEVVEHLPKPDPVAFEDEL